MKKLLLAIIMLSAVSVTAQTDLALLDIYPVDYARAGSLQPFYGLGKNVGATNIAFVDVTVYWQFNGGTIQSGVAAQNSFSLMGNNVKRELTNPVFTFQAPSTPGSYPLKVWVKTLNPDINSSNDSMIKMVKVIANLPQKNVILETFKHQTCGPCYSGDTMIKGSIDILPYYNTVNIYTVPGDVCYSADGDALEMDLGPYPHPRVVFDHYVFPHEDDLDHNF